jgi:hypothetical protein
MNKKLTDIVVLGSRINARHVQLVLLVVSLAMLILGIGAPADSGGPTRAPFGGV